MSQTGFTIVELATVILIIGILAALTISGYNGVQTRARDSTRVSDMKSIGKALEIYKSRNGAYPVRAAGATDWAYSRTFPGNYIEDLAGSGKMLSSLPNDPINEGVHYYAYYVYAAGMYGCDSNLGRYYILAIPRMESVPAGSQHPDSPGFKCPTRDWHDDWGGAAWVQGGFVNG